MKQLLLIFLLLISTAPFAQNSSNKKTDAFIRNEALRNAAISICVADTKTDSVLLSVNPQLCVVPASVQKLVTSAAALEILGPGKQFTTMVWSNGSIANGKLTGDLVVTGGGDPTLGSENFVSKEEKKKFLSDWVHWIRQAGIDTITGNILADPSVFTENDTPGSWLWEDLGNHYGATASGIAVYDNIFELVFNSPSTPGQATEIVKSIPEIPGLTLQNEVLSSSVKSDEAYVFGSPLDSHRLIKGTLPAGVNGFHVRASVPDPSLLLVSELKKALADSSVVVLGNIGKQKFSPLTPIDTSKINVLWLSPKLTEIIAVMNKESNNLYAETLMKHVGLSTSGEGSTSSGTKAITDFWNKKGIGTNSLFMADGSGLSRANALSSRTLVDLLVYMKNKSQNFEAYYTSIPLTGIDGTQKNYFQESILKGKARAKTGSMTRVRSMAGYMTTLSGREVAFSIIVNNYSGGSSVVKLQIEKLLESIYNGM